MRNESKEKAIAWIKDEIRSLELAPKLNGCPMTQEWAEQLEIMGTCLEAVQDHFPDSTKMMPLEPEQLQAMKHPTPIWAEVEGETIEGWSGYWCLCQKGVVLTPSSFATRAEQMGGVKFYSYPPFHINQEAWEPCMMCKNPKFLNLFLEMNCRYCPKCGRPLTPSARAELKGEQNG